MPGELRLEVTEGKATGFSFAVDERLVIGRNSEGPGKLADDPELSRHHAEIARTPSGDFTIRDLSSTNGTHLNGARLSDPAVLAVGDEIEVGGTKLSVRSVPVPEPPPGPATASVDVRAETITGRAAPTAGAPVELRLTVDFAHESAALEVDGTGEPIRLVLDHGKWRVGSDGP